MNLQKKNIKLFEYFQDQKNFIKLNDLNYSNNYECSIFLKYSLNSQKISKKIKNMD